MMTKSDLSKPPVIAFQGWAGAHSDLACRAAFPDHTPLPCPSFEETMSAVRDQRAQKALIPVENSLAGRVADIHYLLPESGLQICGEYFQPIRHCLLGIKGTALSDLRVIHSHVHALGQCKNLIRKLGVEPRIHADTAGAAHMIAEQGKRSEAAIASYLAADIYGLDILIHDIHDANHNTTRFLVMENRQDFPALTARNMITSLIFTVRSVPAALYKCLGGFATNGLNMTKLESYLVDGSFTAAQFYADIEGHPDMQAFQHALEELRFFSHAIKILGVYPASDFRAEMVDPSADSTSGS